MVLMGCRDEARHLRMAKPLPWVVLADIGIASLMKQKEYGIHGDLTSVLVNSIFYLLQGFYSSRNIGYNNVSHNGIKSRHHRNRQPSSKSKHARDISCLIRVSPCVMALMYYSRKLTDNKSTPKSWRKTCKPLHNARAESPNSGSMVFSMFFCI